MLAAGLLTPFAALAIAVVMLTAIGSVHWRNGFWSNDGGYEFNLVVWAAAVSLAATGPARFSIDRFIGWDDNLSGLWWGLGVLVVSALIAAATLTLGRYSEAAARVAPVTGPAVGAPTLPEDGSGRASPVGVEVGGPAEGGDLTSYLRRRGLPASLVENAGLWNVEVGSRRHEAPELVHDLFEALEHWLPDRSGSGVVIRVARITRPSSR